MQRSNPRAEFAKAGDFSFAHVHPRFARDIRVQLERVVDVIRKRKVKSEASAKMVRRRQAEPLGSGERKGGGHEAGKNGVEMHASLVVTDVISSRPRRTSEETREQFLLVHATGCGPSVAYGFDNMRAHDVRQAPHHSAKRLNLLMTVRDRRGCETPSKQLLEIRREESGEKMPIETRLGSSLGAGFEFGERANDSKIPGCGKLVVFRGSLG